MFYDLAIGIYDLLVHLAAPFSPQTPEDGEGALGGVRSSSPTGRERRALHLVSRRFSGGV